MFESGRAHNLQRPFGWTGPEQESGGRSVRGRRDSMSYIMGSGGASNQDTASSEKKEKACPTPNPTIIG